MKWMTSLVTILPVTRRSVSCLFLDPPCVTIWLIWMILFVLAAPAAADDSIRAQLEKDSAWTGEKVPPRHHTIFAGSI